MKRLVCIGRKFIWRGGPDASAPHEPRSRLPQKATPRAPGGPYRLRDFRPLPAAGNGYRPGPLLQLGPDQCRYTIRGRIMCGARTDGGSWCAAHGAVVRERRPS